MLVLPSVKVIENKVADEVEDEVNVTLEVEVTIEKVDVTKEDNSMIRKILVFQRKFLIRTRKLSRIQVKLMLI